MRFAHDALRLDRHRPRLGAILTRAAVAAAAIVLIGSPPIRAQKLPAVKTDTGSLVEAVATYLQQYKRDFAHLVADEDSLQTVIAGSAADWQTRRLRGEIFLAYLEADRAWMGVHDVVEVNGQPVGDVRVRDILLTSDLASVKGRVMTVNSRYNIGRVTRNFNEPTFALNVIDPQHRDNFKFDRAALETRADGTAIATLSFIERGRPTLVRRRDGSALPMRGELTLEAATGRVLKTLVRFDDLPLRMWQTTDYGADERLALLVPTTFEEYYILREPGTAEEHTSVVSTYSNYRRFAATGRVK